MQRWIKNLNMRCKTRVFRKDYRRMALCDMGKAKDLKQKHQKIYAKKI